MKYFMNVTVLDIVIQK